MHTDLPLALSARDVDSMIGGLKEKQIEVNDHPRVTESRYMGEEPWSKAVRTKIVDSIKTSKHKHVCGFFSSLEESYTIFASKCDIQSNFGRWTSRHVNSFRTSCCTNAALYSLGRNTSRIQKNNKFYLWWWFRFDSISSVENNIKQ